MQRYRAVILIVLFGVVPVVAAFFAALYFLKDEAANPAEANAVPVVAEAPPAPEPPENRKVLAAARALPVGTLIGEEDLTILALDLEAVRKGHILVEDEGEDKDEAADVLRGYAVRESLRSGEALVWSSVVGPGQRGFLAAVLGPGTRAVTIRVGPATSHAGLIDPGDRVDVILSAELQATERERTVLARTIVEDVRVVAVDRRVGNGAESSGGDAGSPGDAAGAGRTEMITATLEVSPAQGDRLVLGEHEGKLSLAVRSLAAAAPRTSDAAVELRDLLLSPESVDASALEERMREELALMEERLRAEEEERLRAVEEERLRLEEEERLRLAERERLRAAVEEERLRLGKKLALMEKRLQAEEEERLRAAEEERLRLEEEERLRLAEEERLRAQEEERLRLEKEERLRLAEEERLRLGKKLALMEKRLQAEEEERLRAADEERLRLEEEKRLRLAEEERSAGGGRGAVAAGEGRAAAVGGGRAATAGEGACLDGEAAAGGRGRAASGGGGRASAAGGGGAAAPGRGGAVAGAGGGASAAGKGRAVAVGGGRASAAGEGARHDAGAAAVGDGSRRAEAGSRRAADQDGAGLSRQ